MNFCLHVISQLAYDQVLIVSLLDAHIRHAPKSLPSFNGNATLQRSQPPVNRSRLGNYLILITTTNHIDQVELEVSLKRSQILQVFGHHLEHLGVSEELAIQDGVDCRSV